MPTPEEMRVKSKAAKEENQKKAAEAERQRKKEYNALMAEIMARKEAFIHKIEFDMSRAGSRTNVRTVVNVRPDWGDRENYQPVLQAVVDHFVAQGFKANYTFDNHTEYHGDGAGPGPDDQIVIVDWSEDA